MNDKSCEPSSEMWFTLGSDEDSTVWFSMRLLNRVLAVTFHAKTLQRDPVNNSTFLWVGAWEVNKN